MANEVLYRIEAETVVENPKFEGRGVLLVDGGFAFVTLHPVAAVEVVHGRWVNVAGCRTICNHCGEYPLYDYWGKLKLSAYCPNCGAKMDGDGNG